MEFRTLTYFLAVVQEKSISQAAKILHISQPALSRQLKQLETELGTKLFNRGHREIHLTEEGTYLANRGKKILSLVDKTIKNITTETEVAGEITIGGGETKSMKLVAKIIDDLVERYPELKVNLYSGNADDVLEKLEQGLIDFGLVIDPVEKQKYAYKKLPAADQWGLLIRQDHFLASKKSIIPADLLDVPLYVSSQTYNNNKISEWFGGSLDSLHIIGTYNLLYNASLMVGQGVAGALCIAGIIDTANINLTFIPLQPELKSGINIIWKKEQKLSRAGEIFIKYLEKV
ncbi:LysR family transcriptional regulator [Ligilactobacillus acidipiscis]|uniref:LysR family transcriptional regulator n=1 Tax=Ligilactobacillus acidipiscis TaxID=89059 RepID=UPI0022E3F70C|nr:LysR family transcriptional regulator [Ligilactobacillus acidipiscis]